MSLLKWRSKPARDGTSHTMVEVDELGAIAAVFMGPGRWRLTWRLEGRAVRSAEGNRYDLFDALVDWGFTAPAAGEVVTELYGG